MDWIARLNCGPKTLGGGLEVLSWNYASHLRDNVLHRHTYFEVCLLGAHGEGTFTVENRAHVIEPGTVFFARPGVAHRIQNSQTPDMELWWVCFGWHDEMAPVRALWRAFAASSTSVARDDGSLLRLWELLREVAASAEWSGKNAQLGALETALLLEIARLGAGDSLAGDAPLERDPHRLARLAARYIDDNLGRRLSIDEIAAHVGVSPRHFARLFIEFAGVSPSHYLQTARLDRARHLLRADELPIKTIAGVVGFADVQHFTRTFSRRFGLAPAAWRQTRDDVRNVQKEGELV